MRLQVLTPSYNSHATIDECLNSACEINGLSLIVVDDGSVDGSAQLADSWDDVTVFCQQNAGPSVARNRAILESDSEFVMFLDSDDLLRPGFREEFEKSLNDHPDGDVFVCGMEVINETGQTVDWHEALSLCPTPYLSALVEPIPTNGIIVRRSLFNRAGLFDTSMKHAEDWDLWLRLAAVTNKWVRMDHKLAVYRLSGGSLSKNGPAMWRGIKTTLSRARKRPIGSTTLRYRFALRAYWRGAAYVYQTAIAPRYRTHLRSRKIGTVLAEILRQPTTMPFTLRDGFMAAKEKLRRK